MSQILRKADGAYSETAIDDEIVVMSLEDGDFFSLTGSARAIWLLIDGTRSRAAVLAALAAEFSCPEGEIAPDLDAFLADLSGAGLLAQT